MPQPKKGRRLGGDPAHQRHMLANLATALFEHGRVTTTETRARSLRPMAEKLITKARKAHAGENPLHHRREVLKTIHDKAVVHELFTEIAPGFADRPGGYTRITKLGPRKGDKAPMAVIELVTEPYEPQAQAAAAPQATPAAAPAPEEPAAEEPATEEPATEEPTAEEPTAEEPTAEEPTAEEPTAEEPTAEEPAAEEPAAHEAGGTEASESTEDDDKA